MGGAGKEGTPIPAVVARVFEDRAHAREIQGIEERYAGIMTDRVTNLIRATVPDPYPTYEERRRIKYSAHYSDSLSVEYSFESPSESEDQAVKVWITNTNYPRESSDRIRQHIIQVADGDRFAVSADMLSVVRKGHEKKSEFDEKALEDLIELIDGIEQGIQDGTVQRWIRSPLPVFERNSDGSFSREAAAVE